MINRAPFHSASRWSSPQFRVTAGFTRRGVRTRTPLSPRPGQQPSTRKGAFQPKVVVAAIQCQRGIQESGCASPNSALAQIGTTAINQKRGVPAEVQDCSIGRAITKFLTEIRLFKARAKCGKTLLFSGPGLFRGTAQDSHPLFSGKTLPGNKLLLRILPRCNGAYSATGCDGNVARTNTNHQPRTPLFPFVTLGEWHP